jgi:hypothetical protein
MTPPPPPPPPPPPEPMAEPLPPPPPPAPVAAVSADDMTGQVGFGVGVIAGTTLVTIDQVAAIKYWLSDTLAIEPELLFGMAKAKRGAATSDTSWRFAPAVLFLHTPWKTTSTRLNVGAGLGLGFAKWNPGGAVPSDTTVAIRVPIEAGVEHFFTRWFSMGIAVQNDLFSYSKTGDNYDLAFTIDTTHFMGSLFFYTD